jgi:hypothetical protein
VLSRNLNTEEEKAQNMGYCAMGKNYLFKEKYYV